ncbi:hypothetical protein ONE63_000023 [Megalurothrips usitatus]|uniref:Reverse transcriptase domain-containing protein n=1 Tax=Megalurothrips usitatus TaxID=439358 RepID=A0AAV7Y126_9NEOP|nr:hypothetical protein ONE63_000023 [Megalurothrips usitatus]
MEFEKLHDGCLFVRSNAPVTVPAKKIKWVKVHIAPGIIEKDTVFTGNPHLFRNYKVHVSDFILTPCGKKVIQVTNTGNTPVLLSSSLNLAVDGDHEDVFFTKANFNNVQNNKEKDNSLKFNINSDLLPDQKEKAQNLLVEFKDVFVSDVSELSKCNYPPIRFDYDKNKVLNQMNYRMSVGEKEFAEKYIQKLLDSDLIEYCTLVYCTPILVVPKQSQTPSNPSYRLVQDYRKLNKVLTDIKYPIPDQQDLIDSFQGKFWHSVTDNCSGYTQLEIHPDCRDVTAFDSASGSRFRWKALPQGLSIAPALYALAMDHLLMKMKKQNKVVNYFDDTHIGTESFDQHLETLREYFELLREHEIQLNIKKSTFFQRKVTFLGFDVDGKEVSIPKKRINATTEMVPPKNKDELRSTLEVFGYNRRFTQNYSQKAYPLLALFRNDVEFKWEEDQQNSFELLKSSLSNPASLRLFDPQANNRFTVDASYKGLGVAYYQQDRETKRFHPVGFVSRKLKCSETKLPIYYLECSALVFAFVNFRCYVQNRNVQTEVLTDH